MPSISSQDRPSANRCSVMMPCIYMLIKTGIIQIEKFRPTGIDSWNWHPLLVISTLISALLLVLPGYLSGWFATRRGAINGIFVIVICYTSTFFIFSINHKNFVMDFVLVFVLLQHLILPVAVGAVSGSAGQFHKRIKGGL